MSNSNAEHNREYLQKLTAKLASLSPEAAKKVFNDIYGANSNRRPHWVFIDVLDGFYDSIGTKEES